MNAKEMFEKLGYKQRTRVTLGKIKYIYNIETEITFDIELKTYDATISYCGGIEITVELHQAITQQMRELGWIE